ncbi:MAG: acyltransferase [Lachnospiraceae bacterium]|nr:acyltransferase [Lachnospiraceae bacterium]
MEKKRIKWIDGLKLFACLCVFFSHLNGFLYSMCDVKPQTSKLFAVIMGSSYNFFVNGNFWVCVFCVISGYFASKKRINSIKQLVVALINRYLRFFMPFLGINIIAVLVANSVHFDNVKYSTVLNNKWIGEYYNFKATIWIAIRASIKLTSELDCPLWMIKELFIGTCIIYIFRWLLLKMPLKIVNTLGVVVGMAILVVPGLRALYIYTDITFFGVFLAQLIGKEKKYEMNNLKKSFMIILPIILTGGIQRLIIDCVDTKVTMPEEVFNLCNGIDAFIILIGLNEISQIKRVLESEKIQKVSKYAFSIFLVHWLVLSAFTLKLYGLLIERMSFEAMYWINFGLSTIIVIAVSVAYYYIIENGIEYIMKKIVFFEKKIIKD